MRTITLLLMSMFLVTPLVSAGGEDTESRAKGEGERYKIYEVSIDNKASQLLLDSEKGKMWILQTDMGTGKKSFTGITVEGLAYSKADIEGLEKQIQQWSVDGLVDKEVTGFKEAMHSEFSYFLDSTKAKEINEGLKPRKK